MELGSVVVNYLSDLVFLAILFFGLVNSYTDIKKHKIKNISIVFMLLSGVLLNLFITKTLFTLSLDTSSVFFQTIINMVLSFVVGFALWSSGIWSSGDGKLFFGFASIVPVTAYKFGYFNYFPSFVILLNTFVPVALFYAIDSIRHIKLKQIKSEAKPYFKPSKIFNTILFVFGFSFVPAILQIALGIRMDLLSYLIIIFVTSKVIQKFLPSYMKHVAILFSALRMLLLFSMFSVSFFFNFLLLIIMFQVLNFFSKIVSEYYLTKSVKIEDLEPGVVLVGSSIKTKKGKIYEKGLKLTDDTVKELIKLKKEGRLDVQTAKVSKLVPLAPFIFLGVLLTYILNGSLLYHLIVLKSYALMYIQIFLYKLAR